MTRFSSAALAALLLGTSALQGAFAQQAEEDVIVVTGTPIRDSQAAAILAKRNADNVIDIISADTIGRFPDQNLADSLGRVPGLAIERDQGQARYINFRGAPFRYTAIAFDGIDVPGAENGRIARFDSFPSVITSAVEANKAITPDMPGEAVSGFINIKTFDPFDREGLAVSGEAGVGEQDLGGGIINKYNLRTSFSNDQFGVVVFGSRNYREQTTDNREFGLIRDGNGGVLLEELDFRSYIVERKDNAYGGTVEFRPTDETRLFLSSLYTEFVDNEERNQWVFGFQDTAGDDAPVAPGTSGFARFGANALLQDGRYDNSTTTTTLGADWMAGDWSLEGRLNYTQTENNTFLPIIQAFSGAFGTYDLSDRNAPELNLLSLFDGTTPVTTGDLPFFANIGIFFGGALENDAYKVKLDAERDMMLFGRDATVKTGFQYDTREAEGFNQAFELDFAGVPTSVLPTPADLRAYDTGRAWETGFNNSIGGTYFANEDLFFNYDEAVGGFDLTPSADQLVAIEEDIFAAYAMATTEFDGGNIVYGARVEATDYTSDGPEIDAAFSDDYVSVLPSAHLNLDLSEDVKFRLSASTGVSRPTYNELRASAILDIPNQVAIGGNPTLDPETSWGGDAAIEWYFDDASILSAGVFYRSIDDVIYADVTTVDGGIYLDSEAGETWTLTGFENGKDGQLTGLELNFIGQATDLFPSPFDGLGASANATFLDSEFETQGGQTLSLPGTSDVIYNASVFYEKYGLSARVNYQYRDAWLSTTENDGLNEFWDEQSRVDASVRYVIPQEIGGTTFTLFANGNNLTDETDVRYEGSPANPNQVEAYGSRFLVGIRGDY